MAFDSSDPATLAAPQGVRHRRIDDRLPGDATGRVLHSLTDMNGDSRSDLLVQKGRKELRVFLGVPGPDLFARRPQQVAVAMPNEEYTWLVDLNKDGKQDVLMHHPFTLRDAHGAQRLPPGTEPHRVTMLIAR